MTGRALPPTFDLSGRAALVTGAGSATGIGFATARLLAAFGARVVLTGTGDHVHERVDELRGDGSEALPRSPTSPIPRLPMPWSRRSWNATGGSTSS